MNSKWKETLTGYLFILPFLVVFLVFLGYPVVYSFILSFYQSDIFIDWYNAMDDMQYVGLENYKKLLTDSTFWWSLILTFYYALLTIPTTIALSLVLAILLNNELKGKDFFRTAFFLPNILDLLVIGMVWVFIFTPGTGLLDMFFKTIGFSIFQSLNLLDNPITCLPVIAFVMVLKGAGFGMILFLASIQNISSSVYEAAEIDGANKWQQLTHITIPLVKPIILFMTITGTIGALTAFTEIYAMTGNTGGPTMQIGETPMRSANLAGYYLYRRFVDGYYGEAAAISFILLFIALGISLINMKLLKSE